jgi:ribokinase
MAVSVSAAQMKTIDVVVVGGANSDYVIKGPALPKPGETVEANLFLEAFGGKGANQAVACARLGARVAFVGRVGNDHRGRATIQNLRREKVNVRHLRHDSKHSTGAALVMVDARGEKQIQSAPGANRQVTVKDIKRAAALIRSAQVLLMQYELPVGPMIMAAKIARESGALVIVDPAPARPTPERLLRLIDVIRPNSAEAKTLTGLDIRDEATARRAAAKLFAAGLRMVCFQIQERGDLVLWPGGEHWLPRLKVKTVDATGAGDAFAAGIAVALAHGRNFREAGMIANATAALATTKLGAQPSLPRLNEVVKLLRKVYDLPQHAPVIKRRSL